jgi:hypothetical protein
MKFIPDGTPGKNIQGPSVIKEIQFTQKPINAPTAINARRTAKFACNFRNRRRILVFSRSL